jgi:hypothetical protein
LADGFTGLRQLVGQQLTLSAQEKAAATAALNALEAQLGSPTSTVVDIGASRQDAVTRFPWLEEPLQALLSSSDALQRLGQIAARSL